MASAVAALLAAVLLACSCTRAHELRPLHISLDERRQAGNANLLRCLTATVERPTIGQCIDVFSKPVPLRVCVRNETEAQARVDLPVVGPRVR
jgi:hypothetical protein